MTLFFDFNLPDNLKKILASLTLLSICICIIAFATQIQAQQTQQQTSNKPTRILFLVDASSSMTYNWQGSEKRMTTTGRLISAIVDSLTEKNPKIEFGLRLIGSQYPAQNKVCTDTKLEVPFGTYNGTNIVKNKARTIKPYGFTPIAYSLQKAAEEDFVQSDKYNYSIILVTDGGESCNGDICAIMQQLLAKKISFKPYILSLVKDQILENQYECLGTYINVLEPKDFQVAIDKIIEDNHVVLDIPAPIKTTQTTPKPVTQPIVTPKPVDQPKPVIKRDTVAKQVTPKVDTTTKPKVVFPIVDTVVKSAAKPVVVDTAPVVVLPEIKLAKRLPYRKTLRKYTVIIEQKVPKKVKNPKLVIAFDKPEPEPVAVVTKPPTPATNPTPNVNPKPNPEPAKPPVKVTTVQPTIKNKPKEIDPSTPAPNEIPPPKEMDIAIVTEKADKTLLKVIFVNDKGKQFFTEPMLTITNTKTKAVRKEKRKVTTGSKAINPIEIESGAYTINVGNSTDYTKTVDIKPNELNIVTIKVNPSSLGFAYLNNKKRPVKEYQAFVSNRFSQTREVTTQPCDKLYFYEPGSYHLEVNTLPPTMYFLDLEIGVTKLVNIPETGTFSISNTTPAGKVELFYQDGNIYKPFYNINVTGNPAQQSAEILPGLYQVRYMIRGEQKPRVIPFSIKSNMTTQLEITN